jgi:Flp pilus assembly pilin Flp
MNRLDSSRPTRRSSTARKLLRDRRGAAMTEYVALLGTVCISAAAA